MTDLDDFWTGLNFEQLKRVHDWDFEREDHLVYVLMPARDGERFRILFLCDGYRARAPDPVFVDSEGSKMNKNAWPRGDSSFDQYVKPPPNAFICMPLSRAGLERHAEWRNDPKADPWDPKKHSLLDQINFIHRLLHSTQYQGRHNG